MFSILYRFGDCLSESEALLLGLWMNYLLKLKMISTLLFIKSYIHFQSIHFSKEGQLPSS